MTRIQLHRSEHERGWPRILMLGIIVLMLGIFSSIAIMLLATETCSGTFAPISQVRTTEWDSANWPQDLPVAFSLLVLAAISALAIGVHTLQHGGMLGFAVSLFNLLPLHLDAGERFASLRASPLIWGAFFCGALLAFYVGDIGSWICRRRLQKETAEDLVTEMRAGKALEQWL